jgi:serine/threonine-protein kinase
MHISAETWQRLSQLLDEALDLDADARNDWMARLAQTNPDLEPLMRRLLAAHAAADVLLDAPQPAAAATFAVGDQVGPYRLKRELGFGGMADVWLAERADGAFIRDVALKVPRANRLRRDLQARFRRERDILARLSHAHIARFYDAGVTEDGLAYMAMEYVAGEPITAWCDQQRLDVRSRLVLFAQVLDAVQYAHANLVIHRDLKPSNILVAANSDVRLLDFGIAKLLGNDEGARETELTRLSGRALTPDYASPEQVRGEPLTIATDIYSLGVVLCELVCGSRPYRLKLESTAQLEQAIVSAEPRRPSEMVDDEVARARRTTRRQLTNALDGDIDSIVLKALEKSPGERYQTVAALGADIQRHLAGEPVRARRTPWPQRTWKFVLRNRVAVGAASVVAIALVAATAVSLTQAQHARDEAAHAEEVKRFVVSFFEAGGADSGANRKTTAVDMLLQARTRLEDAPMHDPASRVELLRTIGSGLSGFGEAEQAEKVLAEAVEVGSKQLGDDRVETAIARVAYASVLSRRQRALALAQYDAAEPTLRRAGNLVFLAALLRGRALISAFQEQFEPAIDYARQAVAAAERQPEPKDRRVLLAAYRDLATVLRNAGRKEALEPARRAYDLARALEGEHPTAITLDAQTNYAETLATQGDYEFAIREVREVTKRQVDLFGADSSNVAASSARLARLSLFYGDTPAAIDAYRTVLRISLAQSPGKSTQGIGNARLHLGDVLGNARHFGEALAEWRESERIFGELEGRDHLAARVARAHTALALTKLGRLDEADAVFADLARKPFASAREKLSTESELGRLRSAQGRHDEAEALLAPIPAAYENDASPRARALALAELGYARVAAGRNDAALPVLLEARALLVPAQPNGSPDLANMDVYTARARLALGDIGEALTGARRAVDYWQRVDPRNREHAVALLWQARALAAMGDSSRAAQSLDASADIFASAAIPGDGAMVESARALVASAHH